jgi:mono/diheme cytochrome c family protein
MSRTTRIWLAAAVLVGGAVGGWYLTARPRPATTLAEIVVPAFSPPAQRGLAAFVASCAGCHGEHAAGSDRGPPLVHKIYHPGHHADQAFVLAARNGTRAHHWRFGDMPAQRQVSPSDLDAIIRYVRELQQANGIF